MRIPRFGKTLTCLALVTAMLAPASASAARRSQTAGLAQPGPVSIAWSWLARMLGMPLQAAVAGSEDPGGLDKGPGIDPIGGQGATATPPEPSGLDMGSGIDPIGGH